VTVGQKLEVKAPGQAKLHLEQYCRLPIKTDLIQFLHALVSLHSGSQNRNYELIGHVHCVSKNIPNIFNCSLKRIIRL